MCGIGKSMVTLDCEATSGPTDPPLTTEKPCDDVFSNCGDLAEKSCYKVSESKKNMKEGKTVHGNMFAQNQFSPDQ